MDGWTWRSIGAVWGIISMASAMMLPSVASAQTGPDAAGASDTVVRPGADSAIDPAERVVPVPSPAVRSVVPTLGVPAPFKRIEKALRSGPLLIHGNFCGVGNRPGGTPIDALDAACMRHDACTRTGKLPGCACNDRLRVEASIIAEDPRTRPDVKAVAAATAAAMSVLICKTGGTLAVPIPVLPR